MSKVKVLVTGGAGFIGSHTVVELQNQGFEVVVVDNLSNTSIEVLDGIKSITGTLPTFYQLDVAIRADLDLLFEKEKDIDAIIHFAASKAVGESVEKPLLYYQNNLISTMLLLEKMKACAVPNLIFSSSCTVYGSPDHLPVTESTPVKPAESPYGNTKQVGEEIIADTMKIETSLKAISLRYFNPIGAHESCKIGELPKGVPANLMPFITQTAIGKRKQLKVFGADFNTIDGTAVRDYIHVVDLAKAHVVSLKRLLEDKNKANYEVFNVGTGTGYSVLQVIKSFEKTSGLKLNYEIVGRREGDIEKIYADTTIANTELGWKAALDLDKMTDSAWKWEQSLERR